MAWITTDMPVDTPEQMEHLGARIAELAQPGWIIYLHGDLGAGKTTFTRGFIRYFLPQTRVKSPTFTLLEPYEESQPAIYHFDLYRLSDPEELAFLGVRDYLTQGGICLVEWPEKGKGYFPDPALCIHISHQGSGRQVCLETQQAAVAERLDSEFRMHAVSR